MALFDSCKSPSNVAGVKKLPHCVLRFALLGIVAALSLPAAADGPNQLKGATDQGIFLVATDQLAHSSFKETVILITHHSEKGATGLAINRPSEYRLNEIFPEEKELRQHRDEVYLGGPVHTTSVFVLMRTKRPHANMYKIAKDLYFSAGINALTHGLENLTGDEHARAYVGYTGWAPGQLEHEIHRGDWIIVHADPNIVFDQDHRSIWRKLRKSWSGQWI